MEVLFVLKHGNGRSCVGKVKFQYEKVFKLSRKSSISSGLDCNANAAFQIIQNIGLMGTLKDLFEFLLIGFQVQYPRKYVSDHHFSTLM